MTPKSDKPLFLFILRSPQGLPDPSPDEMQQIFGKWMTWLNDLKAKGIYLAGDPLDDPGKVLRGPRGSQVTDGPFAEAKEIVGGYMLVKADSLDAAAVIARDCPGFERKGSIEVRPIQHLPDM